MVVVDVEGEVDLLGFCGLFKFEVEVDMGVFLSDERSGRARPLEDEDVEEPAFRTSVLPPFPPPLLLPPPPLVTFLGSGDGDGDNDCDPDPRLPNLTLDDFEAVRKCGVLEVCNPIAICSTVGACELNEVRYTYSEDDAALLMLLVIDDCVDEGGMKPSSGVENIPRRS